MPRKSRGQEGSASRPSDRASIAIEDSSKDRYRFKARFGALIAATGVAGVPRALCHYLGELGLSYADLGFITHILSYRWTSAYPFPSQRKLAEQAGIGRSGIQRRAYALQALEYLQIAERYDQDDGRRTSNGYDLTPLLDRLNELILRDWDTVWKHRDPLVSDDVPGEADSFTRVDNSVDNSPDRSQESVGDRLQKWEGPHPHKAAGDSGDFGASPADKNHHEEESIKKRQLQPTTPDRRGENLEKNSLRATTTTVPTLVDSKSTGDVEAGRTRAIDRVVADYSDQFDDRRHLSSNRTQARRLCQQSGLEVEEFVQVLYEAGARTASHLDRIEKAESDGIHHTPKVMPYFFGVIRGVLRERGCKVEENISDASKQGVSLDALCTALSKRVKREMALRWLDGAQILDWNQAGKRLLLGIADPAGAGKLRAEYSAVLQRAIDDIAGPGVSIEVEPIAGSGRGRR